MSQPESNTTGIAPETGPGADHAFRCGMATTAVGLVAVWVGTVVLGVLTPVAAIAGGLLSATVVLPVAGCLLGMWLGYADEAQYRGAKVSCRNNGIADDEMPR